MTGSAGRGSAVCGDAAEFRDNPGRSARIVKHQFPEVTLRLGGLEERIWRAIGEARLREITVVRRHHQLLDATDLRVDEPAQLGRAAALRGGDAAVHQRKGNGHSSVCQRPRRDDRLLLMFACLQSRGVWLTRCPPAGWMPAEEMGLRRRCRLRGEIDRRDRAKRYATTSEETSRQKTVFFNNESPDALCATLSRGF